MLTRLAGLCVRHAWPVIVAAAILSGLAGIYAVRHFAITTDTDRLMLPELPWIQRKHAYQALFPPKQIVAVVQAPTSELAGDAANRLANQLGKDSRKVRAVAQPQADPFLLRAALLFLPLPELERSWTAWSRGFRCSTPWPRTRACAVC
jgi:hypothetical protein